MEDGKNPDSSAAVSEIFCELCSLEFTAKSELEEHSWSLLHNTNLNRKKGRNCIHPCSLCNQSFVGLLDFTSHIHGEKHQDNIHKWRKEQHEDNDHNENGPEDWTTDDVSKVLESKHFCQENSGVPIMADYYDNQECSWSIGGPPTAKHVHLMDLVRDERITEFGLRYQDQLHGQPPLTRDLHAEQSLMNESRERVGQWDTWHYSHEGHHQKSTGDDERDYTSENGNDGPYYFERDELTHSKEYFDPDLQRPTSSEGERYDIYYGNRKECKNTSRKRNRGGCGWSRHHNQRHGKPASGCRAGSSRPSQEDFSRNRPVNRSLDSSQQGGKELRRLSNRNRHSTSRDCGSHPGSYQERRYIGDDQSLNSKTPDQVMLNAKDDPQRSSPRSRSLQTPAKKSSRKKKPRKLRRSAEKKEDRTDKDDTLLGRSHTTHIESTEMKSNQKAQTNKTKKVSGVKETIGNEKAITYSTVATTVRQSGGSTGKKGVKSRDRFRGGTEEFGASSSGGKITAAENYDQQDFGRAVIKKEGKEIVVDKKENVSGSRQRALSMRKKEILPLPKANGPVSEQRKEPFKEGENVPVIEEKGTVRKKGKNVPACRKKGAVVGKTREGRGSKDTSVLGNQTLDLLSFNIKGGSLPSCEEKGLSNLTPSENENVNVSATKEEEPSLLPEGKRGDNRSATKGKFVLSFSPKEKGDAGPVSRDKENHLSNIQEKSRVLPVQKETLPSDANAYSLLVDKQPKKRDITNSSGNTLSSTRKRSEDTLRSLLGIKKEPLDLESEDNHQRDCSSNSTNLSSSGIVSPSMGMRSPSSKVASSRLIPVLSQMSLSRPQCSFVHIDGVQCGAVTWNKYCSYHQRIEEEKTPGNSGLSEGSYRSKEMHRPDPSWKSPCGRSGGTRVFRPQMPLDDLPVGAGLVRGTASGNSLELSHSSFSHSNGFDETAKDPDKNTNDAAIPSGDIDLNSTLPTVGRLQDSATDANPQREIYLGDTVPRPGRTLSLHGSPRGLNSSPNIDLSQTVLGRNGGNGSKTNRNPTVQKYANSKVLRGPSTDNTRNREGDISEEALSCGKSSTLRKATVADSDPIIDLNQTVPRPGRMVLLSASSTDDAVGYGTDLNRGVLNSGRSVALSSSSKGSDGNSKVSTALDLRSNLNDLASSRLQSHLNGEDAGETHIGQRSPASSSCNNPNHSQSSNPNTEMIDLNFSTKLLGIPHSVGGSFSSASNRLPKTTASPLGREVEHSSSDFVARSPGYYNVSSPQSPLSSRLPSEAGVRSPGVTIPVPNLSLDLSRFNLPPAVRQALAERYNTKSQPSCANAATGNLRGTVADGRRSQPLFSEDAGNGVTDDSRKTMSSLPRRLRCQRSVSLDSLITKSGSLPGQRAMPVEPLDREGVWGPRHLIAERKRNLDGEESQYVRPISHVPSVNACNNVPGSLPSSLSNVVSSTVDFNRLDSFESSHGFQRGGLIDLSATTYLEGISEASRKIDSQAGSTTSRADQVQSPERCTVLPSQGLIDLNSSASFRVLSSTAERPVMQSIIKRKRLSSQEPQGSLGLSEENLVKRRKHGALDNQEDTAATYQAGLNVQGLLIIERDEEEQLQALHDVQSRLKSVRAQIQRLCTELDALHSEENRISIKMGELRNLRLSILENACYEKRRRASTTRVEIVSREPASSRTCKASCLPETSAGASNSAEEVKATGGSFAGSFSRPLLPKTLLVEDANPFSSEDLGVRSDYDEKDMEMGSDIEQVRLPARVQHEGELRASCSTGDLCSGARASGGRLQTSVALEANQCQNTITQCESSQPTTNPSNRSLEQSSSSGKIEVGRMVTQTSPSGNKPKALGNFVKMVPHNDWNDVTSSALSHSEGSATGAPVLVIGGNNGQQKELRNATSQTKNDLGRKIKHLYRPEKSPRRKSFSDVNVSKTIEASRKKIQSVKENMKRWKKQEEEIGNPGLKEGRNKSPNDFSSAESNENSFGYLSTDELAPTSSKSPDRLKSNPRKTTKELKKSSLFQSRKKNSGDGKDKSEATHCRSKSEEVEGVPPKKRKIEETLMNGRDGSPAKETTTSSNEERPVVNSITHTTATNSEGSGTENTTGNEDEVPTRDVDTESEEKSSGGSQRVNHLQIPSSTVESLKKGLLKGKLAGNNSRGPTASKFSGHTGAVCGLKVHNGCLFACSADKTTRSFDLQTGECSKVYLGHHQAVNCLEILADKDRLFTGSNDQTVRSYNIKSGVCSHKFTFDGRVICLHAAFDLLFVGLSTGIVASIDVNSNKCLERLHCHEPRGVSCLTSATEGQRRLLCTGSYDSTITIRDFKSGLLIRTLSDHVMTVLCLQVVENVVYSGSADMKVQAHNLNTGELLRSFLGHTQSVSGLQIVGRVLVTACLDKLVRCYDLMSAELLQVYGGQMDMIFSVYVNNGKIYSGARDGSVTGVKLDLRVYHPCKWTGCQLNFGIVAHLRNHLREYHVMEQGTVEACHWAKCGHQFSAEDDIKVVLRHVLGHVVSRSARTSVS